jgi:hypothetical protein
MNTTDLFLARTATILAARLALQARAAAALAAIHADDRDDADYDATINCPAIAERTFAFRKAYVETLEMMANAAPEYGLRRA